MDYPYIIIGKMLNKLTEEWESFIPIPIKTKDYELVNQLFKDEGIEYYLYEIRENK